MLCNILIIYMKKFLNSDWVRVLQVQANTVQKVQENLQKLPAKIVAREIFFNE